MPLVDSLNVYRDGAKIKKSSAEPLSFERYGNVLLFSSILTMILWFSYEVLQLYIAAKASGKGSHMTFKIWIALACEFFLSFPEMILAVNLIFTLVYAYNSQPRSRYELSEGEAPSIDVFITCCGEPMEVILDTICAAKNQNYPKSQFKIFVLDDGHDENLRKEIDRLNKDKEASSVPDLIYLSRKVGIGQKSYFKAGNIQFGIEESNARSGSEYIASLDADMIPQTDWLRKIIPHLMLDDKVALVAPPQDYYNAPIGDPFGNKAEFDLWFSLYEPLNDRLDSAMCTGTGYVVRRQALDDIGGWPQVESGEDYMCSTKLSDHGWIVAFIPEKLQTDSGTAVHKSFGFYLPGSKLTSKLDALQRVVAILTALRDYSPITTVLSLLVLPLALFPDSNDQFEKLQSNINTSVLYHTAYRCFLSLLPSSLTSMTFDVSGAIRSRMNERSSVSRATVLRRLSSPSILLCLMYCIYASMPLSLRLNTYCILERTSPSAVFFVFPGVIIKTFDCIAKASVPVWYMMFPPTMPNRRALLAKKVKGGKEDGTALLGNGILFVLDLMSCFVLWRGLL
ncbi:hypothetical protein HYALB_00008198 [Hymenoscyphus albidus]|uniref:Glycosyltransferase 2-like domain-containing protein n=1 Tax=Hymenoscyphus albidus TaxID=595503 RepID=A0A9N9QAG4_9HELO|nr:hypothetical protein HYALB_00008198 [Hymenoscyphus albidus]